MAQDTEGDNLSAYARRLSPFIERWRRTDQKIAIFGIGPHTDYLFAQVPNLETVNLVGYIDSNQSVHGKIYRGKEVYPVAWAEGHADVVLCSSFVNELQMAAAIENLSCKVVTSHTPLDSQTDAEGAAAGGRPDALTSGPREPAGSPFASLQLSAYPSSYDVIVFPIIDWSFRFQRPQQLAVQLAEEGYRVFYIRNTFQELGNPVVQAARPGIFTVHLPGPAHTNVYAGAMRDTLREAIERNLSWLRLRYHIIDAACFVDLPFWTPAALSLGKRFGWKIVYDCMDYHAGFTNTGERMLRYEQELSKQSDLVVTSSHRLHQAHSRLNPRCLYLPNAVDFEHFRFPMRSTPPLLSTLPKPILGYYGAIAEWFDSALVAYLARKRSDWTFVLIGHTHGADLKPFKDLPNVHVLPEQDYLDLPSFLHAFDVCLIPFKKIPLTHATNPVKLFEYCSSGKPIVASALRELRSYQTYVRLPETRADWLREIEDSLVSKNAADSRKMVLFARENTWKHRMRTLKPWLDSLFPKVSIVLVTYGNLDYTRLCLESIYARTIYPDFEVIVTDNHSSDGTADYLRSFADAHETCRILINDSNAGFARANNQGARLAAGEYLIFLNNDTIVTRNWLSPLVSRLADRSIGMVGPVTNWSGNETRIPVPYRALCEIEGFAETNRRTHDGRSFEIRMLPFCCVGMRRAVFEEVGPLDERYGIGMFEDDDYAMRVRAKGYRIMCAEDSFIHHWGRASFEKLDQKAYADLFEINRRQFEAKWGVSWQPHRWRQFSPPLSG